MIKKNLEIIGIEFKSQLEKNDIHFWWQKKYTEILKGKLENKNELLISLNNALEELEKIDIATINSELKNEPKRKNIPKKNKSSFKDKSFNAPQDGGKAGQSKIEREFDLNNNQTSYEDDSLVTPDEWKNFGDKYKKDLDYERGIYCYTKALEKDKKYFDAFLNRGICNLKLKFYTAALSDFDNAKKLSPQNIQIYLLRGKTNFYLKNFKNAVADFDQYIQFEKRNHEAFFMRGNSKVNAYLIKSKTYLSAFDDYQEGYKLNPNYKDDMAKENFEKLKEIIKSSSKKINNKI